MRTQVAIIGAGPAGMFLAHLLHTAGIACVVLEHRDRAYVEARVRAGVLEPMTVRLMEVLGLATRLNRQALRHRGVNLSIAGQMCRIDLVALVGAELTVYGQQKVMRDLFDGAEQRGIEIRWNAHDVSVGEIGGPRPIVTWREGGAERHVRADFVAGCDGFRGVCRKSIPQGVLRTFERVYPFGWLGLLADVPPCHAEVIYATHERGFALASMRSAARSRYYIQIPLEETVEDWPDERFWDELCARLRPQTAASVTRGRSLEKSITPIRSFVVEPMQWGGLFLAGDAAHVVPPIGAKGLNLAVADVVGLAEGFIEHYRDGSQLGLASYSQRTLSRVWKAERFSTWLTSITHRFEDASPFAERLQQAELDYLRASETAQRSFAENCVGLPLVVDKGEQRPTPDPGIEQASGSQCAAGPIEGRAQCVYSHLQL